MAAPCQLIDAFVAGREIDSDKLTKLRNTLGSQREDFRQSERMRFHFTSWRTAGLIARNGFRPSEIGMQGKGVYLTDLSPSEAIDGCTWPSVTWRNKLLQASHRPPTRRALVLGPSWCTCGVGNCWGRDVVGC